MKKFTRTAATLFLFAAICATAIVTGMRPTAVATPPRQQKDDKREKLQRLKIQTFRGEAAALRAKELRKLNKGIARAMKDAEKRGLRPAFEQGTVIIATDPAVPDKSSSFLKPRFSPKPTAAARRLSFRSAPTQDTFTDGEYEVTFIPYDDGEPEHVGGDHLSVYPGFWR